MTVFFSGRYLWDVLSFFHATYATCSPFLCSFFFVLLPMAMGIADLNNQTLLAIVSLFISLEVTGEILPSQFKLPSSQLIILFIDSSTPCYHYCGVDMAFSGASWSMRYYALFSDGFILYLKATTEQFVFIGLFLCRFICHSCRFRSLILPIQIVSAILAISCEGYFNLLQYNPCRWPSFTKLSRSEYCSQLYQNCLRCLAYSLVGSAPRQVPPSSNGYIL